MSLKNSMIKSNFNIETNPNTSMSYQDPLATQTFEKDSEDNNISSLSRPSSRKNY
jgi:hypothetical protein